MLLSIKVLNVKTDISDDECGIEVEDVNDVPTGSTDNPIAVGVKPKTDNYRKRIPQKSLLIVFDGTSSMNDDLAQMRDAAKEIMTNLSSRKDKPIKNYVLSVFRDPC